MMGHPPTYLPTYLGRAIALAASRFLPYVYR